MLRNHPRLCNAHCMSIDVAPTNIPQWDLADRLAKSMRHAGISITEMADYFDVHRNSISGWINGRIRPDTRTVRLWAFRTGVPYEWLTGPSTEQPVGYPDPLAGYPQCFRSMAGHGSVTSIDRRISAGSGRRGAPGHYRRVAPHPAAAYGGRRG